MPKSTLSAPKNSRPQRVPMAEPESVAADESDSERMCQSFDLPVTKQTRTYHFRTLRDAGLICDVDYGNKKGIRLRRADIDRRFPGLLDLLVAEFSGATR